MDKKEKKDIEEIKYIKSNGENGIDSEKSIFDDLLEKMLKLKEISEDKNNIITYKMNFGLKA